MEEKSDKELFLEWRDAFKGSHREFCLIYDINYGNFKKWKNGKKESIKCRESIIDYLQEPNKIVPYNFTSAAESVSLVRNFPDLKRIYYIDGDCCSDFVRWLHQEIGTSTDTLILYFRRRGTTIVPHIYASYIYIIESMTKRHDASDHNITFTACLHDVVLYKKIEFIFVSADRFIEELFELFTSIGRNVQILRPEQPTTKDI